MVMEVAAVLSNSTKAIPGFAGTMRVREKPGNCWKSIESMASVVVSPYTTRAAWYLLATSIMWATVALPDCKATLKKSI